MQEAKSTLYPEICYPGHLTSYLVDFIKKTELPSKKEQSE